jgi:hypothetical protein
MKERDMMMVGGDGRKLGELFFWGSHPMCKITLLVAFFFLPFTMFLANYFACYCFCLCYVVLSCQYPEKD